MGNRPKGTFASLPPRSILGNLRWPRPARKASKWPSKALASSSCILMIRVDSWGARFWRALLGIVVWGVQVDVNYKGAWFGEREFGGMWLEKRKSQVTYERLRRWEHKSLVIDQGLRLRER
eukprot:1668038-Pyramimonas_sp.AAC.1